MKAYTVVNAGQTKKEALAQLWKRKGSYAQTQMSTAEGYNFPHCLMLREFIYYV